MNVAKCMKTKVIIAKKETDYMSLLCKIVDSAPRQAYIVDDNYKLLGIVSAMDLLKEIIPSYLTADLARSLTDESSFLKKQIEKAKSTRAADIMIENYFYVRPYHQLLEADALITEKGFNTLPVLDEHGKILGEITRSDILLHLINRCVDFDHDEQRFVDLALPQNQL